MRALALVLLALVSVARVAAQEAKIEREQRGSGWRPERGVAPMSRHVYCAEYFDWQMIEELRRANSDEWAETLRSLVASRRCRITAGELLTAIGEVDNGSLRWLALVVVDADGYMWHISPEAWR